MSVAQDAGTAREVRLEPVMAFAAAAGEMGVETTGRRPSGLSKLQCCHVVSEELKK